MKFPTNKRGQLSNGNNVVHECTKQKIATTHSENKCHMVMVKRAMAYLEG